jgi:hypothetical protein
VTLQWLGEAGNKAEAGQLEDETACLSSTMAKNQPKRRVQSLDELSTISKSCTDYTFTR